MTVDSSDPEIFQDEEPVKGFGQDTPEADAAEQHTELQQHFDALPHYDPAAANPADAAEQARVVDQDEDDYR